MGVTGTAGGTIAGSDDDTRYRQWIDGEQVGGSKGTYPIVNPATEELVGLAPEGSADDARKAAAAAAAAFRPGHGRPPSIGPSCWRRSRPSWSRATAS